MFTNKNLFSNACKLVLALVLFTSCEPMVDKNLKSSKLELRQLVQETENKKSVYAYYFLIAGSYSQSEHKETKVKVFAKVKNRYRLIEMPIEEVRIAIDNKLKVPNIEIEYINQYNLTDEELVSQSWRTKVYVINCPEQYLPEKLLPIGL
jgi:hypothetical protein